MITEKQNNKAKEKCHWRKEVDGVSVCRGNVLPCALAIEKGVCDALIELFAKERKNR